MQKVGIILVLMCVLSGCVTMEGGLSHYEPAAIVSIVSNKMINWEGEETRIDGIGDRFVRNSLFSKQTTGKVTQTAADDLIEEAAAILYDTLSLSGIAKIAAPADVLETPAYLRAETNTRTEASGDYLKPAAYKFLNNADKDLAANLALEEGIRSTMYLDLTFCKVMANGIGKNGSMRAKIIMKVTLLDESGKKMYSRTHEYVSVNRIQVVSAAFDNEELKGLFREALYEAASGLVNIMNTK